MLTRSLSISLSVNIISTSVNVQSVKSIQKICGSLTQEHQHISLIILVTSSTTHLLLSLTDCLLRQRLIQYMCYDHALLVTGYDVLLSTLQGDLSFSTSSASSFASTHAGPDHFHLTDLRLRHHALSDSCLEPPSRVLPHGQLRSFDISTPLPLDVTMTYDSDPDSNPYPFHDIIAYRSPTIRPLPLTLTIRTAIRYWLIPLHDGHFPLSLTYCTML